MDLPEGFDVLAQPFDAGQKLAVGLVVLQQRAGN